MHIHCAPDDSNANYVFLHERKVTQQIFFIFYAKNNGGIGALLYRVTFLAAGLKLYFRLGEESKYIHYSASFH